MFAMSSPLPRTAHCLFLSGATASGKTALGLTLVPKVVESTPAFVDMVRPGSPAAAAGLQPDDLILFMGDSLIQSLADIETECKILEHDRPLSLTVRRGQDLKILVLRPE